MDTFDRLPLELATIEDIIDELEKRPLRHFLLVCDNTTNTPGVTWGQLNRSIMATNMALEDCDHVLKLARRFVRDADR